MKEATDRPRDRVMASGLQELSDELQGAPGEGSSERPPPAVFTPLVTAAVPRTDRRAPGRPRRRDLGGLRSGRSPGDPSAAREGGHRAPPSARRLRRRPRPRSRWPSSEATRPAPGRSASGRRCSCRRSSARDAGDCHRLHHVDLVAEYSAVELLRPLWISRLALVPDDRAELIRELSTVMGARLPDAERRTPGSCATAMRPASSTSKGSVRSVPPDSLTRAAVASTSSLAM